VTASEPAPAGDLVASPAGSDRNESLSFDPAKRKA